LAVLLRIIVFAFRTLGLLLLVRMLVGGLPRGMSFTRRPSAPPPKRGSSDLVRDRVCNTFLPRDRAVFAVVKGREEAFCSAACRDRAIAEAGKAS
jgi:hypothetical protein